MATGLRRIVLLLAISSLQVFGRPGLPLLQPPLQQTTLDGYHFHLESLRNLVHACHDDAKACNPAAVGSDEKIVSGSDSFQMRWQWLRKLIGDALSPSLADRGALLDQASARLDQDVAATTSNSPPQPAFAPARHTADTLLARPEFRIISNESWLDRKIAEALSWLGRILSATSEFGHRSPWLAPVIEWTFVVLTVVFVIIWVMRTMKTERLDLAQGGIVPLTDWQKESAEWADLARIEAEANNWREAIHCLYWASIVVLESRRLWRRDFARTPREYVALLERNSKQQLTLRKLTGIFERIWYGLRDAAHEDYQQALALFEDLRHA
jgi:hypothetical protein